MEKLGLSEKRGSISLKEGIPAPWLTPSHKQSTTSVVWNISIGQLGLAAWLCSLPAPAHLLFR